MRTDSCRTCGVEMKEFQRCTVCSEVNAFICAQCRKPSDEQVHAQCGSMRHPPKLGYLGGESANSLYWTIK